MREEADIIAATGIDSNNGTNHDQSPVFILGLMERCGSNFLSGALLIDPCFQLPNVLDEDYVLEHAHLLIEYVEKTYRRWKGQSWIPNPEELREELLRRMGNSLLDLLSKQVVSGKRLLAKTPAAFNMDKFFDLFPDAKLLVLIRDGRDVVESAIRKWPDEPYEFWVQQWANGAREILKFMRAFSNLRGTSWELVRYEDLLEQPDQTIGALLSFLGLHRTDFDWNRLHSLPVYGSSQHFDKSGQVSCAVVEKTNDFKFRARWKDKWSWSQKRKFKKIAGKELAALGYVSDAW
jgi:sulfotransferase family protein